MCAASDGTFLVSANGRLVACGSNEDNKLGFNSKTSGLRKRKAQVRTVCTFSICMGREMQGNKCTCCLTLSSIFGDVISFRNGE